MTLSSKSLAGPGYVILNGMRVMNIVGFLAVIAASVVMIVFGGLLAVFSLLGAIAVIVLLFTGGAGEWYAGRHDRDESAPVY